MTRSRLGVVLLLPGAVAAEVDGLRRASGDPALLLVPPHITLVPPVNVRDTDVDEVVDTLRSAAAHSAPLRLTVGPIATFDPLTPVLYLSVHGDLEALTRLRSDLWHGPLDRPAEWPYVAHVTLATDVEGERIAAGLLAMADFSAEITVDRLHLMAEGDDRVWRPLADATLGPPAIVGRGGLPLELSVSEVLDPPAARSSSGWRSASAPFAITARREGDVVAVATGTVSDELVLDGVVVDPVHRRQGVGAHVAAAVEQLSVDRGCRRSVVVVPAGGLDQAFYGNRGWTVDLTLPAWRPSDDFVRMVRVNTS